MVAHENFYETIQEARMRLRNTIVKYKDDFYYVIEVGDHMLDGKFRVYMDQLGHGYVGYNRLVGFPSGDFDERGVNIFHEYDEYIDSPSSNRGFIRKYANSRNFEKFRPFPLGNVNQQGSVVYCERTPTRNMNQGLLQEAVLATQVVSAPYYETGGAYRRQRSIPLGSGSVSSLSPEFYDMLRGLYPSYKEVVDKLRNPEIMNNGCAFHREYSVMRGPVGTLLLCYKHSGVGIIDTDNSVTIGSTHEFLRDEMQELGVFSDIKIKEVMTDEY